MLLCTTLDSTRSQSYHKCLFLLRTETLRENLIIRLRLDDHDVCFNVHFERRTMKHSSSWRIVRLGPVFISEDQKFLIFSRSPRLVLGRVRCISRETYFQNKPSPRENDVLPCLSRGCITPSVVSSLCFNHGGVFVLLLCFNYNILSYVRLRSPRPFFSSVHWACEHERISDFTSPNAGSSFCDCSLAQIFQFLFNCSPCHFFTFETILNYFVSVLPLLGVLLR